MTKFEMLYIIKLKHGAKIKNSADGLGWFWVEYQYGNYLSNFIILS